MILSLFIWAGLFLLLAGFHFWKKKPILGWLFLIIGIFGMAIGYIVISIFPDKI
ncbi:MAG: hypothetical protein P8100_07220 [bacterium]